MEYLNHLSLKCEHPFLRDFPISFSPVKLKLGHKRDGKLGLLKSLDCTFKFYPIH